MRVLSKTSFPKLNPKTTIHVGLKNNCIATQDAGDKSNYLPYYCKTNQANQTHTNQNLEQSFFITKSWANLSSPFNDELLPPGSDSDMINWCVLPAESKISSVSAIFSTPLFSKTTRGILSVSKSKGSEMREYITISPSLSLASI